MSFRLRSAVAAFAGVIGALGCATGMDEPELDSNAPPLSFEEFEAQTYREPWDGGAYVVNGDTPVLDVKALREFYDAIVSSGELIVHSPGGVDAVWTSTQKLQLTYCVSDSFGTRKAAAVAALATATANWEAAANVNFTHVTAQDSSCTATNTNVLFDVRPVSNQPYLARAFFPGQARSSRNVLVDTSAFGNVGWSLSAILTHELGHALGFRHEHTRPEAGTCFEDNSWRALTPYDSASVMHYPQCNGSSDDLAMTARDREGAASIYGAPGGGNPTPPPPQPSGTPKTATASGSLTKNQTINYQPQTVVAGTEYRVSMTGTGDPDLYVRFGSAPTLSQFACRPYLSGASETCTLTVPSGQTSAYVMVRGYTAATYSLSFSWTAP
jgi:hypothetical protein